MYVCTGPMLKDITDLSRLRVFNLSENHFTGQLPREIGMLTALNTFDVHSNQLSGPISVSAAYAKLPLLRHLYLQSNRFTGVIPEEVRQIRHVSVETITRYYNTFGTVPCGKVGAFVTLYSGVYHY